MCLCLRVCVFVGGGAPFFFFLACPPPRGGWVQSLINAQSVIKSQHTAQKWSLVGGVCACV